MSPPAPLASSLQRALGAVDYFTFAFGTIVGVGWIVVMNDWLKRGGPAGAALGYLLGGVLLVPIGVVYGRLTARIPRADSEIAFMSGLFPPWACFAVGWMMALGYLIVCPFEAVAVGQIAAQLVPELKQVPLYQVGESTVYLPGLLLGWALVLAVGVINYRGIRQSAQLQNVFTFGLLAIFVLFSLLGLTRGRLENLRPPFADGDTLWGPLIDTFAVLGIVPYFMAGFEAVSRCSEERSLGFREHLFTRITLLALGVGVFFYVVVILVVASLHPWPELAESPMATTVAFERAFGSDLLVKLILFGALLSLVKVYNGCFLASTRLLFAMGRAELVAPAFGQVHARYLTPTRAIVCGGLFSALGCCLGKAVLGPITEVGSFAYVIGWLGASLAYCRGAGGVGKGTRRLVGYAGALVAFLLAAMKLIPGLPVSLQPWEYFTLLVWIVVGLMCWHFRPRQA